MCTADPLAWSRSKKFIVMTLIVIAPKKETYLDNNAKFAIIQRHRLFFIQKHSSLWQIIGANPNSFLKLECFKKVGGDNSLDQKF